LQHSDETAVMPHCSDHRRGFPGVLGIVAGSMFLLAGCARTPDEERIRAAIRDMAGAVEQRRAADFLEHVAADFTGNDGDFDRRRLTALIGMELLRHDSPRVTIRRVDAQRVGDRATVTVDAAVAGGGWRIDGGETLRIVSGWRKEGADWRCYNARWERDGPS
jgi:hypothetical protein